MAKCEQFEHIYDAWGVGKVHRKSKKWCVLFGDSQMYAFTGTYPNRRRAKKEITHYIKYGAPCGCHGMRSAIMRANSIRQGGAS